MCVSGGGEGDAASGGVANCGGAGVRPWGEPCPSTATLLSALKQLTRDQARFFFCLGGCWGGCNCGCCASLCGAASGSGARCGCTGCCCCSGCTTGSCCSPAPCHVCPSLMLLPPCQDAIGSGGKGLGGGGGAASNGHGQRQHHLMVIVDGSDNDRPVTCHGPTLCARTAAQHSTLQQRLSSRTC